MIIPPDLIKKVREHHKRSEIYGEVTVEQAALDIAGLGTFEDIESVRIVIDLADKSNGHQRANQLAEQLENAIHYKQKLAARIDDGIIEARLEIKNEEDGFDRIEVFWISRVDVLAFSIEVNNPPERIFREQLSGVWAYIKKVTALNKDLYEQLQDSKTKYIELLNNFTQETSYKNPDDPAYNIELAQIMAAFQHFRANRKEDMPTVEQIDRWIDDNHPNLGTRKRDRLQKIINWNPGGGRPKNK